MHRLFTIIEHWDKIKILQKEEIRLRPTVTCITLIIERIIDIYVCVWYEAEMASAGISLAKNIMSLSSYSTRILAHLGMTCKACLFDCFHILLLSSKRSHTCLWLNQTLAGSTLKSKILLVRRQVTQIKFDGYMMVLPAGQYQTVSNRTDRWADWQGTAGWSRILYTKVRRLVHEMPQHTARRHMQF